MNIQATRQNPEIKFTGADTYSREEKEYSNEKSLEFLTIRQSNQRQNTLR